MLNKLSKLFFWLFLISLPFGYRVLLFQFTAGFDEYEAVFLYASDILMVLFLLFFSLNCTQTKPALENQNPFSPARKKVLFPRPRSSDVPSDTLPASACGIFSRTGLVWLFIFFLFVSIFFASYKLLALYNFARLVLLVSTALAIAEILKRNRVGLEKILATLAGLAVFQALIGFVQFLSQKSLGLWFLGESILGPDIPGTAKIIVAGGQILRAYGTFPHPNILAAFLLLGLFSSYYFLFRSYEIRNDYETTKFRIFVNFSYFVAPLMIFLISLGLVLTFSRAAWFLGLILTGLFMIWALKIYRRQALSFLVVGFFIFLILFSVMNWLIVPRLKLSLAEPAVSQRLAYNQLGWFLIKTHPWGLGLGNQVIYSVKHEVYQSFGLRQVWQWQPIHNIYLLISSEIGILGLMILAIFLAKLLITEVKLLKSQNSEISLRAAVNFLMISALLGFGLFDHFLWTLQPGRLMFWLVLGIILGTCPRS